MASEIFVWTGFFLVSAALGYIIGYVFPKLKIAEKLADDFSVLETKFDAIFYKLDSIVHPANIEEKKSISSIDEQK